MRQMDKAAIRAALPWDRLIEALAEMFREGCEAPLRHRHGWDDGAGAQNTLSTPRTLPGRAHFSLTSSAASC